MENNTQWDVLTSAHEALRSVVRDLTPEDGSRPTPCSQWNVTQVVQHAAGDQLGYAAAITGGPGPDFDPFSPSGQLTGTAFELVEPTLAAAAAAWATVGKDVEDAPTPLPQSPLPAWVGAGACAMDAAVHAWDIAVATGRPSPLTAQLAKELLPVATEIVEPLRSYGVFAPVVDATGGGDVDALLRYLGRDPAWASAR
jgi:uncharacterized protein (TIGR03086 family)